MKARLLEPLLVLLLSIAAAPALAACDRSTLKIAVDVGHTPKQPGAISARGKPEYRFNRQLARRVAEELRQAGFEQLIDTNPDQAELALLERSERANRAGASLFLSIHHDSAQPQLLSEWTVDGRTWRYTDDIAGHSLFVSERNGDPAGSLRLARLIGNRLRAQCLTPSLHHAAPIPGEGRTLLDPALGIYRFDELAVLRSTQMAAVLIEAGVIVNREEELLLRSAERQTVLAQAIAQAVVDHCEAATPALEPATHCR
ncbi:N-acetylmuramoyl-L-alanine amidase [Piscinibacter sakaiensis]|uniref:N-acetylmuramoyl-L-alanine amidase n=1 Tax=Piscinibacter sakaiensis TaxID=1547922 RepID=UPI003AAAAA8E